MLLAAGAFALVLAAAWSMTVGAANIDLRTVSAALFSYEPELTTHQIVREVRLPRVLLGAMVGACFAVAGAVMQGMTRNPLASPSIMGLNAGAGLFMAVAFVLLPGIGYTGLIIASLIGASVGAALVFGIGTLSRGGLTPVKLALAGATVAALLTSLTTGFLIYFERARDVLFYTAGGVQGARWEQVLLMAPWLAVGLAVAVLLSGHLTVLSLGEEIAIGLGQRAGVTRAALTVVVLMLAGAAVAVAGGIGFVGLVVPHLVRFVVGLDYRRIIPASAVVGGLLVVLADLGAKSVRPPFETPIGVLTALIGIPFFLYLARRDRRGL